MVRLLCLIGLHDWHHTARVSAGAAFSKELCTRCGRRRWHT